VRHNSIHITLWLTQSLALLCHSSHRNIRLTHSTHASHSSPDYALTLCACGGSGLRKCLPIAFSSTLVSSSLRMVHSSIFCGGIYRRYRTQCLFIMNSVKRTHRSFRCYRWLLSALRLFDLTTQTRERLPRLVNQTLPQRAAHTLPGSAAAHRSRRFRYDFASATKVDNRAVQVGPWQKLHRRNVCLTCCSENSDKNSDPDAAPLVLLHAGGGGDAVADLGSSKPRRQQKRLEVAIAFALAALLITLHPQTPSFSFPQSDKVAKKPKRSVPTSVAPLTLDEDDNEPDAVAPGKKISVQREKKSFNFIGDVLYNVRALFNSGIFASVFSPSSRGMIAASTVAPR
jgi:hypothetical protein